MSEREPIKPTVDLPLKDAIEELTGFEIIAIQKHYGADINDLGGVRALCGAVWAYENRTAKVSWQTVENMPLRELGGYFAKYNPDADSEQGKELSGSTETPQS